MGAQWENHVSSNYCDCLCTAVKMMGLWQLLSSLRHFKRPIGLAIAEPEVQVISLSDKDLP